MRDREKLREDKEERKGARQKWRETKNGRKRDRGREGGGIGQREERQWRKIDRRTKTDRLSVYTWERERAQTEWVRQTARTRQRETDKESVHKTERETGGDGHGGGGGVARQAVGWERIIKAEMLGVLGKWNHSWDIERKTLLLTTFIKAENEKEWLMKGTKNLEEKVKQ